MQKEIQLCEAEEKELKEKEQEFLLKNREIQDKLHLFLPQLEYSEKAKQRLESELKFNQDLLERKNQQISAMLTNFHLPKSSLMLLVAAFCGIENLHHLYREAIKEKYRFYSYGDCMLLHKFS